MAKNFLKRVSYGLLLVSSLAVAPVLAAPIVSIQPSAKSVSVNDTFSVDVAIADVTDLYGFQFDLAFSPTVLAVIDITEGTFLSSGGEATVFIQGFIDNNAGTITFTADTLVGAISGVTGSGILASVSFQALGEGSSVVELSNIVLLDSTLSDIAFNSENGTVNVESMTAVPLPSTLLLFLSGIFGLGWICKRKKHQLARVVFVAPHAAGEAKPFGGIRLGCLFRPTRSSYRRVP